MLKALYQTFLEERRFLKNCSAGTIRAYSQAWNAFDPFLSSVTIPEDVRPAVKSAVVAMMSDGKRKPSSVNCYLRAMNAFLKWGNLEEHFKLPIKGVPLLKAQIKEVATLNKTQVERQVQFKPHSTRGREEGDVLMCPSGILLPFIPDLLQRFGSDTLIAGRLRVRPPVTHPWAQRIERERARRTGLSGTTLSC